MEHLPFLSKLKKKTRTKTEALYEEEDSEVSLLGTDERVPLKLCPIFLTQCAERI